MDFSFFPSLNAGLNLTSALLLSLGCLFIRQRAITAHALCMILASVTSTLFLICYLTYHAHHGATRFQGHGLVRLLYLAILVSHTILAVVIVPLAATTLWRGLAGRFAKHVAIARVTFPLWLYVSVTGVVIYWMLYHLEFHG